ncbi:HAAS signaling domain-containing protein [Ectobacillus ponti]|uniref:Integral inner membrane protein n=1 Tax=Ectobacillus ponti TaxID=2961894 RepID=A0AA41X457_9BACI|nr:hypothetical protein [Ectobacillus ponti]MCP8968624.1 hypothetical protein [Ectobacillus ponti]
MTRLEAKERYLKQLGKELRRHAERDSILFDYDLHVSELLQEEAQQHSVEEWLELIHRRIGSPQEVAAMWREELAVTQNRTMLHFLLLNLCFFLGGGLLTFIHVFHGFAWVRVLWDMLTSVPVLIMGMYTAFWGLLGYEIGKSFGAGGRRLMQKTFFIALVPNLTLMLLVVFHVVPHAWFQPLLSTTFIVFCIIATVLLYPVCCLGYRWGKKQSI